MPEKPLGLVFDDLASVPLDVGVLSICASDNEREMLARFSLIYEAELIEKIAQAVVVKLREGGKK